MDSNQRGCLAEYLFATECIKKGYNVWGISRSKEPNNIFLPYKSLDKEKLNRFVFNRFDLNSDLKEILDLIDEKKITHIINFAAQGMVAESWKNPLNWYKTNLISQIALHDELRKRTFIKHDTFRDQLVGNHQNNQIT